MKANDALSGVSSIFLDTPPVIYYVQGNQRYLAIINSIFARIDAGILLAVTSPVTLAECMVMPYRLNQVRLQQSFIQQVVGGDNTTFAPMSQQAAQRAAELRAHYNIELLDAFQVGVALDTNCDALLTNDQAEAHNRH